MTSTDRKRELMARQIPMRDRRVSLERGRPAVGQLRTCFGYKLTVRLNLDKIGTIGYALGMIETLTVTTERVDDLPLLLAHLRRMELPMLLDSSFLVHGNRHGLSLGWTATIGLAPILSQADHRMNQLQPWVERHLETLRLSTGHPVQGRDLTDDRLADLLRTLSDDPCWANFERGLTGSLLRVYDLRAPTF